MQHTLIIQLRLLEGITWWVIVWQQSGAKLEIDQQAASGKFSMNFLSQFTTVYANLTNVVARLSWPGVSAK